MTGQVLLFQVMTASTDGTVKWWDVRNLAEAVETLVVDTENQSPLCSGDMARARGVSCLEYEPTISTRYMVGLDNGQVISCNRKAKTQAESLVKRYSAHHGPVYALQRNPFFNKNFLTVGDWCARIWSEDVTEGAIMWTRASTENLTDGCWSPTRPSVFFTTRMDGVLDAWDILYQQQSPLLSTKVADDPLHCIRWCSLIRQIWTNERAATN